MMNCLSAVPTMLISPLPKPETAYPNMIVIEDKINVTDMILKAGMPMDNMSSLAENSPKSCLGTAMNRTVPKAAIPAPMGSMVHMTSFIRLPLRLPKLNPTMGIAACPNPFIGMNRKFCNL